jgi:hypothetical protein
MARWDSKSWDEITDFSERISAEAAHFSERLGAGGGACPPEEALRILEEIAELVRLAKYLAVERARG